MNQRTPWRLLFVVGLATAGVLGVLLSGQDDAQRNTSTRAAPSVAPVPHIADAEHRSPKDAVTPAEDMQAENAEKQGTTADSVTPAPTWVQVGVAVVDRSGEPLPGMFATLRKRVGNVITDHAGWVRTNDDGIAQFQVRSDVLPLRPVLRGDPDALFVDGATPVEAITQQAPMSRIVLADYTPMQVLVETRDGRPVPFARVEAWGVRFRNVAAPSRDPGDPPRWYQIATADEQGFVDMILPGAVERAIVRVSPAWGRDRVRHRGAHVETEVYAGELVRAVVDPRETLTGTVVDEAGNPLPGIYIRAWPVQADHRDRVYLPKDHRPGDGPEPPLVVESTARSDDQGRFKIRLGRPGVHRVVAIPDHDEARAPSEAAYVPNGNGLRLVCPEYQYIEGRLLGRDLLGFRIELHPEGFLQRASEADEGSDPEGNFEVRVRPGTRYAVRATRGNDERIHFGYFEAKSGARMTLALAPGHRLTGRIDDMPQRTGSADVVAKVGRFTWRGRIDQDGRFEIGPLPPEAQPTGFELHHGGKQMRLKPLPEQGQDGGTTAFQWPEQPVVHVGHTPPR